MKFQRKQVLFTKDGHAKKLSELADLQQSRISAVAELGVARDLGDRSENGAYKAARWKLSGIDRRIRQLNAMLRFAKIIEKPTDNSIGLGSSVTVLWNGVERSFTIVGQEESDLADGKLSSFSPIGKALIGKRAEDTITVRVPAGDISIQIIIVT